MKTVVHYKAGPYLLMTENWLYYQITYLRRYRPVVYALSTCNLDAFPTPRVRNLKLRLDPWAINSVINRIGNRILGFYPGLVPWLVRDDPDLVHAHFGPSGCSILPFKKLLSFKLITTFYGYDTGRLPGQDAKWQKRYRMLFSQGDFFLVEGSHMKACLIALGCPEERIGIQRLGIDLQEVSYEPRRPAEDGRVRILIAGSFREKKGIPTAIEAFARARRIHPSIQLSILGDSAGTPREELEKQRILQAIERNQLMDCVELLGYQPHSVFLRELYRHHVLLAPSAHAADGDTEGGAPVSIIEASASGMPVVSTEHCDIPEIVVNGESGYLVPEGDVDALADRLGTLVSDPALCQRLGANGRRHVALHHDARELSSQLEEVYDQVLDGQ